MENISTEIELKDYIFSILEEVKDPEIPALSIFDMGILRDAYKENDKLIVNITPTYSGCPAMSVIREDIELALKKNNIDNFSVDFVFDPPWTTDWMSDDAKERMRQSGIAPPVGKSEDGFFTILKPEIVLNCPFCNSQNTIKKSEFAATACKALYFCNNCSQPFEHFKCH